MISKSMGTGFFRKNLYDKVRADYPPEVSNYIHTCFANQKNKLTVVEVGAGSGKFTSAIIKANLPIKELHIIEPDEEGIKKHKEKFEGKTNFPIIYNNTVSDKTELENNIADIIFCGHCFHWFDFENTKIEFSRILKNTGQVFILGRFLDKTDEVSAEYIKLTRFGKRKDGFSNNIQAYEADRMNRFYGHSVAKKIIFEETISYSYKKMKGKIEVRLDSSGYDEKEKNNLKSTKLQELDELFRKYSVKYALRKVLALKYTTFVFCSNIYQ